MEVIGGLHSKSKGEEEGRGGGGGMEEEQEQEEGESEGEGEGKGEGERGTRMDGLLESVADGALALILRSQCRNVLVEIHSLALPLQDQI